MKENFVQCRWRNSFLMELVMKMKTWNDRTQFGKCV